MIVLLSSSHALMTILLGSENNGCKNEPHKYWYEYKYHGKWYKWLSYYVIADPYKIPLYYNISN